MPSTNGIRVMPVDDHPITRRGLREVLEDSGGFDVVAQAADGVEAVTWAEETKPAVIVMDVLMPRKDRVEACRDILDLLPDTKVLMLTASTEDDAVSRRLPPGPRASFRSTREAMSWWTPSGRLPWGAW